MSFYFLAAFQIVLVVLAIAWLLIKNDELPALFTSISAYIGSYRYWSVLQGQDTFVLVNEASSFSITFPIALQCLNYIILGEVLLLAAYMFTFGKTVLPRWRPIPKDPFLQWLRPRLLWSIILFIPFAVLLRRYVYALIQVGYSASFQISAYMSLMPLALIGLGILLVALWRCGGLPSFESKLLACLILATIFYFTFTPYSRFQFLGWLLGSAVVLMSTMGRSSKIFVLVTATAACLMLFSVAGAIRNMFSTELEDRERVRTTAFARMSRGEDANMLDGFSFVLMAYPDLVNYRCGLEHLEILSRPIPRSLWPGKPIGGGEYMTRLGFTDRDRGTTVGISPSLFGSFYAEGGLLGIWILSPLYGIMLAWLQKRGASCHPFASILIRAMIFAAAIPLMRGGDLPGIYSWIGMSFWPCWIVLWWQRDYLFPKRSASHPGLNPKPQLSAAGP